jgi:hypothetical protein
MGTLLAPPGITLRGVNIGVDPTPGFGDFYVLWRDWANDATPRSWNNYIKPQIAYAAGQAGCNCIGLNTSMWAVIYGSISLATAQAQLVQFVSYCKSLGLWVHLRQGDGHRPYDNTFTSITPTAASIYGFINSMHSVVAAYDNIIGWDIAPEWEATGAALHGSPYVWVSGSAGGGEVACGALQQAIYAGVKIPYSNLPLTSAVTSAPGATGKNSARDFVAAFSLDYISFDAYRMNNWPANVVPGAGGDHRAIVWSDISYFRTTYPNHDILFSEAGVNTTGSETTSGGTEDQKDGYLAGMHELVGCGDARIRGVIEWVGADQDTAAADNWGMQSFVAGVWSPRIHRVRLTRRYTGGTVIPRN